jgi:hypothetical protein
MSDVTSSACTRLQEADQAYHDLMLGALARSVNDENGEAIAFTQTNKDQLLAYIQQLAPMCPDYVPTALQSFARKPLRFVF